jgi:hypothetical protein
MDKIPGTLNVVRGLAPTAGGADATGDYITTKYAHRLWVVFLTVQGAAAIPTLSIMKATDVAGTGATAMTEPAKIYSTLDCATSDVLVKRTDAASYALDAALKDKLVVFEIDPRALGSYTAIAAKVSASAAGNITSVLYVIETRYGTDAQPSMIVD